MVDLTKKQRKKARWYISQGLTFFIDKNGEIKPARVIGDESILAFADEERSAETKVLFQDPLKDFPDEIFAPKPPNTQ